jgi:hypothetical protein
MYTNKPVKPTGMKTSPKDFTKSKEFAKAKAKMDKLKATTPKPPKGKPFSDSKSKSAGLNPLPKKKGSPSSKKVNLPGKPGKPSRMINY